MLFEHFLIPQPCILGFNFDLVATFYMVDESQIGIIIFFFIYSNPQFFYQGYFTYDCLKTFG